ncbi:hypothetical protein DJFAAGMI_04456 [Comamonas sp. PE63]|uniref:Uncharacterized protein n=1 Tax=Comamonas brasiliensis TaxID=1812482 RepID=A0ABS5LZV6_9BURK|nr:hypothetical protein [Comamonas sp. PE63]
MQKASCDLRFCAWLLSLKSELLTYCLYKFHYKKYLKSFLAMRYTLTF